MNTDISKLSFINSFHISQISEKFKTNFVDSASNDVSVVNFLHKLGSIKYEHCDPGIDAECLEKCLSQLNNSSYLDAHGLSICHIVYAREVLREILVKLSNSFLTHCFTPSIFSNVIFLPLLKDKGKVQKMLITIGRLLLHHLLVNYLNPVY